ncbi:transcriptional regulator GlxA family with amidase domain [Streptomyces sp. SAI-135]|nr:transcriptional regulator GlxA family with amidase domain [Streptomyces sp. SAI-135]
MAGKVGNSSLRPSRPAPRIGDMAQRTVLLVLFDGVQSLDVTGPLEVFAGAEQHTPGTYRIRTASPDGAPVRTSSGLTVVPDEALARTDAPHTLVVPGGQGTRRPDALLTDWLREHGPRAERLVSVCTGAIRLAEAGLLDGRRVTTHWAYCDKLARDHPAVEVDPDPIYVRDGQVSTSAGVTSGIDLALALVEEDLGRDAALVIARHLVVFLRRPGNQAQFSAQLAAQTAQREPLRQVQQWITEHPAGDLSVETLAARARLSPRHFRPRLPGRDRHDTGPVRRPGPARTRPPPPGGHLRRSRGDLPRQRLRHPRGHAPRLRQSPRHGPLRIPPPLPPDPGPLKGPPVQIAIVLFDRFTALDAVGPYETLGRLPDAETVFVAERTGPVRTDTGRLALTADRTLAEVPDPDIVIVPGGPGQTPQMENRALLDWLRAADATSTWTTSVCTGSLLLAAAGLLRGRRATSHWLALDFLKQFGAEPTGERVVFDGKYVTAAGVSSGIDMGLTLLGRIAGDEHAQAVQLLTEYDPQPPYDAGSPQKAPAHLVEEFRSKSRFILT